MNKSRRLIRNYKQIINGSKNEVFRLLCPERETEWLDGWTYSMVYSDSGLAEKGCVFETDNAFGTYQWVMSQYDQNNYIVQFVKFIQDKMVVIIDIDLRDRDEASIYCEITYTFTALNDAVIDEMYDENTETIFNGHMKLWQDSMNYFLKTGNKLR